MPCHSSQGTKSFCLTVPIRPCCAGRYPQTMAFGRSTAGRLGKQPGEIGLAGSQASVFAFRCKLTASQRAPGYKLRHWLVSCLIWGGLGKEGASGTLDLRWSSIYVDFVAGEEELGIVLSDTVLMVISWSLGSRHHTFKGEDRTEQAREAEETGFRAHLCCL